jgi:hypothetical protein
LTNFCLYFRMDRVLTSKLIGLSSFTDKILEIFDRQMLIHMHAC